MKYTILVCLLALLLPGIRVAGAHEKPDIAPALEQSALWIPGARSRADAGTLLPSPDADKGRLRLDATGLHYSEQFDNRSSEILTIPYARLVSVSTEQSGHGATLLFVTQTSAKPGATAPHLFVILPAGPLETGAFAAAAKETIERHIATPPRTPGTALPEEKVAISVVQWIPLIVFDDPAPVAPRKTSRFGESVGTGAAIGFAPIATLCRDGGCGADGLFLGGMMAGAGAAAGAAVGLVREFAALFDKSPPEAPGFTAAALQSTAPTLVPASVASLGEAAFPACLRARLNADAAAKAGLPAWSTDERIARLSLTERRDLSSAPATRADGFSDGFNHVLEFFLSRVALVPAGLPGQETPDVPAALVVDAGVRILDPASGTVQTRFADWRAAPRSLLEWSQVDGAALKEMLSKGCNALAGQLLDEAERAWLQSGTKR